MFEGNQPKIEFRDRPLKNGEKYHHYCKNCSVELHPDMVQSHKCFNLTFKEILLLKSTMKENKKLFEDLSKM